MKILVPVKRVVDYNVRIRVKPDNSGVDLSNVKMSMNPFDEIAVEEAVRLKEKGVASEVIVVSVGETKCQETLRTALAMGADRAMLVETDTVTTEPLLVAKVLKHIVQEQEPSVVLMGKQAIDDDYNATGQMLSAMLGWGQATFASEVIIEDNVAKVTREIDGGLQTVHVDLPVVITADLRLNTPRYASLPNIMKAKRKPIETKSIADTGIDTAPRLQVISVEDPPVRATGEILNSVAELVAKIKETGVAS